MICQACDGEGRRMDEGFYCVFCGGSGWWNDEPYDYYEDEWYEEEDPDDWPLMPCETEAWIHEDDNALMFQCAACGCWHNTQAGDLMDLHYSDVIHQPAYTWLDW